MKKDESFRGLNPLPEGRRKLLFLRACMGVINITVNFYALKYMPLADAVMINASSCIFTCIHARIFLKEPISKVNCLTIILVLIGLTFIVQPPFIFGQGTIDYSNKSALIAAIVLVLTAAFVIPFGLVALRALRSKIFDVQA